VFPKVKVGFDMTVEGSKLESKFANWRIWQLLLAFAVLEFSQRLHQWLNAHVIRGSAQLSGELLCSKVKSNCEVKEVEVAVLFGRRELSTLRAWPWHLKLSVHVSKQGSLPATSQITHFGHRKP